MSHAQIAARKGEAMSKEDKIWLCKLAYLMLNAMVYFVAGDGERILYWRKEQERIETEFMEHAEQ